MGCELRYYPESNFGGFTNVDGTIAFYARVNSLIDPSCLVLDIGCGRGGFREDPVPFRKNLRIIKGKCRKVIGIDMDKAAEMNPYLDEFHLIESDHWPLEDNSVDVCICDSVLEHVGEPDRFLSECRRVIKDDGYLCIRTPNILSYFGLFSMLIHNKFHSAVVSRAQAKRKEEDVFPTLYRCNTLRKIRKALNKHGFESCVFGFEPEPAYLSFSRAAYFLGVLYQRFVPGLFRTTIFAFAKKRRV